MTSIPLHRVQKAVENVNPALSRVANPKPATRPRIIAVEGIIAGGKTVLCDSIMSYLRARGIKCAKYLEPLNMDLLKQFLGDPHKYAYAFQLYMLSRRQLNYKLAEADRDAGAIVIVDRSLLGDYVFATMHQKLGNIQPEEFTAYKSVFEDFTKFRPDAIIYLDVSLETAQQRLAARNREGENTYTSEYLTMLDETYRHIFDENTAYKNITHRIDWNNVPLGSDGLIGDADVEKILSL